MPWRGKEEIGSTLSTRDIAQKRRKSATLDASQLIQFSPSIELRPLASHPEYELCDGVQNPETKVASKGGKGSGGAVRACIMHLCKAWPRLPAALTGSGRVQIQSCSPLKYDIVTRLALYRVAGLKISMKPFSINEMTSLPPTLFAHHKQSDIFG